MKKRHNKQIAAAIAAAILISTSILTVTVSADIPPEYTGEVVKIRDYDNSVIVNSEIKTYSDFNSLSGFTPTLSNAYVDYTIDAVYTHHYTPLTSHVYNAIDIKCAYACILRYTFTGDVYCRYNIGQYFNQNNVYKTETLTNPTTLELCVAPYTSVTFDMNCIGSPIAYTIDIIPLNSYTVSPSGAYQQGYEVGHYQGNESGYTDGYTHGYTTAENRKNAEINTAKVNSYDSGYREGMTDGANTANLAKESIFAFFDAPFSVIRNAFNFEVLGVNVAALVFGLLTLGIVIFVVKRLF